jgi:probable rRNA maturation factor
MLIEAKNFSITGSRIPSGVREFPFEKVVEKILGKRKFVSFVFIDEIKMKKLNRKCRGKNKSTDILSFPNQEGGEIFISMQDVRKKAPYFLLLTPYYLKYLFIHGLLHLKGYDHGSKMDRQENKFCKIFKLKNPFNNERGQDNNRNRRGHIRSASGRESA